jgi:hypothetical protein
MKVVAASHQCPTSAGHRAGVVDVLAEPARAICRTAAVVLTLCLFSVP